MLRRFQSGYDYAIFRKRISEPVGVDDGDDDVRFFSEKIGQSPLLADSVNQSRLDDRGFWIESVNGSRVEKNGRQPDNVVDTVFRDEF